MPVLAIRPRCTPAEWSERKLLRSVLRNEQQGWNELIRRYRALMYRCISKVATKHAPDLSNADIDEIFSETLMQLLRNDMNKLRQFDPKRGTKLGSWLGLISANTTYDYLRSSVRAPLLDRIDGTVDPHSDCDRTPLDFIIEKERWAHFNRLLDKFSRKERTFLELYYARGMDATAVASSMAINLKTVYSKKHKVRAHLHKSLRRVRGECAISDLLHVAA